MNLSHLIFCIVFVATLGGCQGSLYYSRSGNDRKFLITGSSIWERSIDNLHYKNADGTEFGFEGLKSDGTRMAETLQEAIKRIPTTRP